MATRVP